MSDLEAASQIHRMTSAQIVRDRPCGNVPPESGVHAARALFNLTLLPMSA